MKCKVCGGLDETNTAYCIQCGRVPHSLVEETQTINNADKKLAEANLSQCARNLKVVNGKIIHKPNDILKAMGIDVIG
ncbi:MAG: hypothetical protein ACE5ES_05985 [Candidatus Nanoarchaeia archaeon]